MHQAGFSSFCLPPLVLEACGVAGKSYRPCASLISLADKFLTNLNKREEIIATHSPFLFENSTAIRPACIDLRMRVFVINLLRKCEYR
jgi:hypothetical protein